MGDYRLTRKNDKEFHIINKNNHFQEVVWKTYITDYRAINWFILMM